MTRYIPAVAFIAALSACTTNPTTKPAELPPLSQYRVGKIEVRSAALNETQRATVKRVFVARLANTLSRQEPITIR